MADAGDGGGSSVEDVCTCSGSCTCSCAATGDAVWTEAEGAGGNGGSCTEDACCAGGVCTGCSCTGGACTDCSCTDCCSCVDCSEASVSCVVSSQVNGSFGAGVASFLVLIFSIAFPPHPVLFYHSYQTIKYLELYWRTSLRSLLIILFIGEILAVDVIV